MACCQESHEDPTTGMARVLTKVGARGLGVTRLCCLVTVLVQGLHGSGPGGGTGLLAEGAACKCGASQIEELPWRAGCQAS
jgi:hypothetical protein